MDSGENPETPSFDDFTDFAPEIDLCDLKDAVDAKNSGSDEELDEVNSKAEQYLQTLGADDDLYFSERNPKDIHLGLEERMIYSPTLDDLNPAGRLFYALFSDDENVEEINRSEVNYWSPK